jgi:DNA processing protein
MSQTTALPAEAYAAALADLPGITAARLVAELGKRAPEVAWQHVLAGDIARPASSRTVPGGAPRTPWAVAASRRDVRLHWEFIRREGIHVAYFGGPGFPVELSDDPDPPGVLFWLGDLDVLSHPRVAIVGTRHCTSYGLSVASELGHDLASCGVCVVSGLALGIDGAAHRGAIAAAGGVGPLGVAASGVDVPYPKSHADLWRRVAITGAVISETAPSRSAQSWRFPARNRLIAGLSRVVVVVESHPAGGSMLTVAAAADRGIEVMAVPGPVNSASSGGTNQLLHEGVSPARHAGDVLAALGDLRPWPPRERTVHARTPTSRTARAGRPEIAPNRLSKDRAGRMPSGLPDLDVTQRRVFEAVDRTPTATSLIADRTGLPLGPLSVVLLQLEDRDLVRGAGAWWELCAGQ